MATQLTYKHETTQVPDDTGPVTGSTQDNVVCRRRCEAGDRFSVAMKRLLEAEGLFVLTFPILPHIDNLVNSNIYKDV